MSNSQIDLSTKIAKRLTLKNPVIMASGTFGHGAEYASLFDLSKIGGIVTKTITYHPRAGNPPPRTAETPSGMLNAIGLTNPGIDAFIAEKVPPLAELNTGRIVSIAGTSDREFADMAARFNDLDGIDALELNISSPNMKDGGMLFGCSERAAHNVTRAVKAVSQLPIIVKLTPNVTDIAAIGWRSRRRRSRRHRPHQHPSGHGNKHRHAPSHPGKHHRRFIWPRDQTRRPRPALESRRTSLCPGHRHGAA